MGSFIPIYLLCGNMLAVSTLGKVSKLIPWIRVMCVTLLWSLITCYLHWLRIAERIKFKLATLTFRCLQRSTPRYLSADFIRVADVLSRRRLCSSLSNGITIGDRAFPVAGANLRNGLLYELASLQTQLSFRRQLKTFMIRSSYPEFRC